MTEINDHILAHAEAGVMTIRMNRPDKKNAITGDMYARMAAALDEAYERDDVKTVLFFGTPGAFSSGNDIADFMQIAMSGKRDSMSVFDFLERIIMAKKPVVAGVDGLAIGVGTTMLLHCDYVIASGNSRFKTPFVDLGLVPEAGSSLIAPEIIGHHKAFALLAMGEGFDADSAANAGFVNKVVDAEILEETARQTASEIAAKPQQALNISRNLIRGDRTPILERMREEAVLFGERLESEEAKQAFMGFMAKGQAKKAG
ncbi:MAG: crotonase/enoyl-CoA hydratase family protein [Pseudomonadota bacterium]